MPSMVKNVLESTLRTGMKKVLPVSCLFISHKMLVHCSVFRLNCKLLGSKAPEVRRGQQTIFSYQRGPCSSVSHLTNHLPSQLLQLLHDVCTSILWRVPCEASIHWSEQLLFCLWPAQLYQMSLTEADQPEGTSHV